MEGGSICRVGSDKVGAEGQIGDRGDPNIGCAPSADII